MNSKVCAVVVTYNRLELLKECITSLRNQTRRLDEIFVINNESTDGTKEWLNKQKDLTVIHQANLGGAGGFHRGMKVAYEKGYDWIWVMDDDSIPNMNALLELLNFVFNKNKSELGFLASKVVWVNNSLHKLNKPGLFHKKKKYTNLNILSNIVDNIKIDVSSFVGLFVNAEKLNTLGLPNPKFHYWLDDIEFTSRFQRFLNYYIPESIIVHATTRNEANIIESNDKKVYYKIRNTISFYKKRNFIFMLQFLFRISFSYLFFGIKSCNISQVIRTLFLAVRDGLKINL